MKYINKDNTLIWLVDTQKDFMNIDGSLYVEDAIYIKPLLKNLVEFAKDNNIKVINTGDWHYEDSDELSINPDFINTFPNHCMVNSKGSEYIKETVPNNPVTFMWDLQYPDKYIEEGVNRFREIIITKDKFDVFSGNKHTDKIVKLIKELDITNIIICGVATNVCVNYAVNGLINRGFDIIAIEDAIKGLPNITSPIDEWKRRGVELIKFNELKIK